MRGGDFIMVIKVNELNERIVRQIVKERNLPTFQSVKAKDLFVKMVIKYTDLLPCELDALYAISRYASKVFGVAWATVETLAADPKTKYGDRALWNGIKGLRDKGIVIVIGTRRERSGGKGANIYCLNPEYIEKLASEKSDADHNHDTDQNADVDQHADVDYHDADQDHDVDQNNDADRVQIVDSDRVQIVDSDRGEAEIPCETSDETLTSGAKKSSNESPTNLSNQSLNLTTQEKRDKSNSNSNNANAVAEENSSSEINSSKQEEINGWELLDGRCNDKTVKYCRSHGVPEEVIEELRPFVSVGSMMTIWNGIKGALENMNEKYEDNIDEVVRAIHRAIRKAKKEGFESFEKSFEAYVVGTMKLLIEERKQRLAEEYEERIIEQNRAEWREKVGKFYGLDVEGQSKSFGGCVYTKTEPQQAGPLAHRAFVLYAQYLSQYQDSSRAFERVIDELLMTENIAYWEAHLVAKRAIGFNPDSTQDDFDPFYA